MASKKKTSPNRAPTLISAGAHEAGVIKLYGYQDEGITAPYRTMVKTQCRQSGKTYEISVNSNIVCCTKRRARVWTLSASLNQGRLNIEKDSEVNRDVLMKIRQSFGQDSSLPDADKKLIRVPGMEDDKGRLIDLDAFAERFEAGKLESRVYWSNSASDFSSHTIRAANKDTARGPTLDLINLDEAFTVSEFKEVVRAIKHTIARQPNAQFKMYGTPPLSPDHESWEMLYDEAIYTPNPRGNWRTSNAPGGQGMPILRVDAYDAELAGIQYYDDITGDKVTVAEYMARSSDKEGDGRELLLTFNASGNALIPYSCLKRAQCDPTGGGDAWDLGAISDMNFLSDEGLRDALRKKIPADWTRHCVAGSEIAFGHDQSTSDKEGKSNPSTWMVKQEVGFQKHTRLCVSWLSKFPRVNEMLMTLVIGDAMRENLRLRGLGVDASNEWHNAQRIANLFGHLVAVNLYKDGEKHPDGKLNWKNHLATQYRQGFLDATTTLPAHGNAAACEAILTDHSLAVMGPGGVEFRTSKGMHFDTGAAGMLADEQFTAGVTSTEVTSVSGSGITGRRQDDFDPEEGWQIPAPEGSTLALA